MGCTSGKLAHIHLVLVPLNLLGKKLFYLPKLLPEFNFPPRIIKPDILTHALLPFKLPPAVVWSAFEGAFVFFFQKIVNT